MNASLGLGSAFRRACLTPSFRKPSTLRSVLPRRTITTQSTSQTEAHTLLNKQRLNRPSSPHFTIYQPQMTWIPSIFNRVTGAGLSVLLYGFSLAYLFVPGTFDSEHIVETVKSLPESVKYAGKFILAAPFAFHSWNGIRHLSWDVGKFMTIKGVYSTGYTVLAVSAVTTVWLTFFK